MPIGSKHAPKNEIVPMLNFNQTKQELASSFSELEQIRKEALAKRQKGTIGVITSIIIGLFAVSQLSRGGFGGVVFGAFIGIAGVVACNIFFFASAKKDYGIAFKNKIVNGMAKALAPEVTYQPQRVVDQSWFERSELFSRRPDRYTGEDYFCGNIGETELFFSEIHAESRHTRTRNGKTETYYKTIFEGILFVADFHKEFQSEVFVRPDSLEAFGALGRAFQKLSGNVERMESPEFERLFKVTANDPIEARYILTPLMQERIVELAQRYSKQIILSFRDSLVYLAIPQKQDWFEANLHTPANNSAQLQMVYNQLSSCFGLVEQLDLNTRIWTKD